MDKLNENSTKRKCKKETALTNTITEIKSIPEQIGGVSEDTEEGISNLEDRVMESTRAEQQKEKKNF